MCFFFQAEDGIRDDLVTGVQTCALPISYSAPCFKVSLNFKDIAAKQGAEYAEAQKKQDEEKQKFQGRSEERRVGKSVDLGGRRIIKKKKTRSEQQPQTSARRRR